MASVAILDQTLDRLVVFDAPVLQHPQHQDRIEWLTAGIALSRLVWRQRHHLNVGAKTLPRHQRSMASSGSPFPDSAVNRLSTSKNPSCPIRASRIIPVQDRTRTGRQGRLFFEVACSGSDRIDQIGRAAGDVDPTNQKNPGVSSRTDVAPRVCVAVDGRHTLCAWIHGRPITLCWASA